MSTITPDPLDRITPELIRRGLPPAYALRAAAELEDHRRDLVDELKAAGHSDALALAEASQRLGDEGSLVKKTVREYQRRYWCGRWPLASFVLAPIPAALCAWFVACLVSMRLYEGLIRVCQRFGTTEPAPATMAVLKLVFLGGATAALRAIDTYFSVLSPSATIGMR